MKFGQYELLELIATGGMAEVYKGRVVGAEGFEKFVAIKRIVPDLSEDDRFVKMLLTEARIHAGLSHRNIVQIHDLGISEGGEYFIVLEFVDGYDLRMIMEQLEGEKEIIPEALSLHIASELAQGLHFAHEQRGGNGRPLGLIHRDVSPSNVLISKAGEVKLSDFGLAKRVHDRSVVGTLKGNLGYMSPEQARQAALDRRTDIFSLGAVLFEMLTGHRLREITNEVKTWNDVAAGMIPSARSVRPDLPEGFERLLARALAPEPSGRFPTAAAFGAEIRALLSQMNTPVGASDLQALLSIINPPRKLRSLMERSKVIRLGPEVEALEEAAKRSGMAPPPNGPPPARGLVVPATARKDPGGLQLTPVVTLPLPPSALGAPLGGTSSFPAASPAVPPPRVPVPTLSGPPPFVAPLAARKGGAGALPPISYAGSGQSTIPGVPQPAAVTPRRRENTPVGYPSPPAPAPEPVSPATPPGPLSALPPGPTRTPSGPQVPLSAITPAPPLSQSPLSPFLVRPLSDEAMAVAATMPAMNRRDPEIGDPPEEVRKSTRRAGLLAPLFFGTLALLALAGAAVHFVLIPLDVLAAWWQPATLTITSQPVGADVTLDGTRLPSVTPIVTSVTRDRFDHVLEISVARHRPVHQIIRYDRTRLLSFEAILQKATGDSAQAMRIVPIVTLPSPETATAAADAGVAASEAGTAADTTTAPETSAGPDAAVAPAAAPTDAAAHGN